MFLTLVLRVYSNLTKLELFSSSESVNRLISELDSAVDKYRGMTYAPSTQQTYKVHYKSYLVFCDYIGVSPVPASSTTLCRYAVFLARSLKYSSVRQYLNIVRLLHLDWGLENPMKNNFSLDCVLKGIRRGLGDKPARKRPITPELLLAILAKLNLDCPFDSGVWAACLIMFFGLLRRSNVLSQSLRTFEKGKHLSRNDCVFSATGMRVTIRWSKVIQYKDRTVGIDFPRVRDSTLCPVAATFRAFQLSASAPPDGPAFMVPHANILSPLTPSAFVKKVKLCLKDSGIDHSQFSGHSFRRGGASWAFNVGIPMETIRQLGDWRSYACLAYIDVSRENVTRAISHMQRTAVQKMKN